MSVDFTAQRLSLHATGFWPIPDEGKRPSMQAWQTTYSNPDEIRLWEKVYPRAEETGILAENCPGIDVDITDEDAAEAVEHLLREELTEHGIVTTRIGNWPKRLIPTRTDEKFAKVARTFIATDGTRHKVEILCDGQQWVAFGIHPDTKAPYRWTGGEPGKDFAREDLPYMRREDAERILDLVETLLVDQHGMTLVTPLGAGTAANGGARQPGDEPLAPTSRIAAAVGVIPNQDLEWDDWNRIGMAIWRATGGSSEGFQIFDVWSRKSNKHDPQVTSKKWSQYTRSPPTHIGAGTIVHLADRADPTWREKLQGEPPPEQPDDPGPQLGETARVYKTPSKSPEQRFTLVPFHELKPNPAGNYLVKGILPGKGLGIVWGPPKCGKSFWVFDLLMHVARGLRYRGHHIRSGPVVYCAFEGQEGFKARAEAYRVRNGLTVNDFIPFYLISIFAGKLHRDHVALIARIKAQLNGTNPVAIALDTLNRSIDGSESKDEDMGKYLAAADAIHQAFGCLIIIIHHCGVDGTRPRGHTSQTGTADVQIAVRRDDAGNIVCTVEYVKDGPTLELALMSRLETVEVGTDSDGDPITSCVVKELEDKRPIKAASLLRRDKKWEASPFRKALAMMLNKHGIDLRPFPDRSIILAVDEEFVRTEFYRSTVSGDDNPKAAAAARRQAWNRATRKAQEEGRIDVRVVGPITYLWFVGNKPNQPEMF